jgi:hypothetical protein
MLVRSRPSLSTLDVSMPSMSTTASASEAAARARPKSASDLHSTFSQPSAIDVSPPALAVDSASKGLEM